MNNFTQVNQGRDANMSLNMHKKANYKTLISVLAVERRTTNPQFENFGVGYLWRAT